MKPKLVRGRIPEIIRESGVEPLTYTASRDEYRRRLADKLREEAIETAAAMAVNDQAGLTEELADVLEVVHAIAAEYGISLGDVGVERAAKLRSHGGFGGRIVWTGNAPREES